MCCYLVHLGCLEFLGTDRNIGVILLATAVQA